MTDKRLLIHAVFLTLSPLLVAVFGLSVPLTAILVVVLLLWRWLIVMSGFASPEPVPDIVLETIPISHFVEKVRWSMDRLGIEYTERAAAGTLGAFYRGRTVPQLKVRTGAVRSVIGNSAEILRYLWGRYSCEHPDVATFLAPTAERIDLEHRIDRYGVSLQVWIYYRILSNRDLTLRAWGCDNPGVPRWQRQLLRVIYPVQAALIRRSFRITDEQFARSVAQIETLLKDMNEALADGRTSLLGGDERNFTDFAFAAITGAWLMPAGYGGGRADTERLEKDEIPEPMRMDVVSWQAAFPQVVEFVERLYAEERHR